ncbi:uncharacterized protein AMSG_03885 [Thecamonas trahens ATCC 50062]|uniref:Uncharacterized protein n=1 Tax=Thecamonas trahens ATCC 50062 TaxID=461836 RepID=A0A0L0D643_THETB|nr:hypothetical protein AMSG_03885 [Thecamonas trahens ATCC 50062]KNC47655.1 hypothetical protein AMSG_03885 [Thecamonas trahens ATCC 50062]|eukprot:XP_013759139.1 hypothetical protein AMSG_03885 [Thecamonas trahens ATCC 50062]
MRVAPEYSPQDDDCGRMGGRTGSVAGDNDSGDVPSGLPPAYGSHDGDGYADSGGMAPVRAAPKMNASSRRKRREGRQSGEMHKIPPRRLRKRYVDDEGTVVNPQLVLAAAEAKILPPRLWNYFLREHLALAVLFPEPLYSTQARVLSRKGRIFMLAFVFLAAFAGAMVYQMMTRDLVSCSAAAYCLANCRRDHSLAGSHADACLPTPWDAQYSSDHSYELFGYPPHSSATAPSVADPMAFTWCGSGELDPPVCVPYCYNGNSVGDDNRPRCDSLDDPDKASWLLCVSPTSISKCTKNGNANDPTQTEFQHLSNSMASDDTESTSLAGRILVYCLVALAVFFITSTVKRIVSFVTKKGRGCCVAFVVKFLGYIIIAACVIIIVVLAILFHAQAKSGGGDSFWSAVALFSTSFFVSLGLDFVKLTIFYFVWPKRRSAYYRAYFDELVVLAREWDLPYGASA